MKYFDLHCDTALKAYKTKSDFKENQLHIALDRVSPDKPEGFEKYNQVLAVFSEHSLGEEETYAQLFRVVEYLETKKPFPEFFDYILGVEGGKLLAGDIARLDRLYELGVRILTLVWGDECCIGGAHNTSKGLTDFGKEVLERCFEIGIIPDVSHSSDAMFYEVYEMSVRLGKPFIASHSNSRAVCCHSRNLTDDMFVKLLECGGIVGISLCPPHLREGGGADVNDVIMHIKHYLELGSERSARRAEEVLCFGCDFDGTELPNGIHGVESISFIVEAMKSAGISEEIIEKIMYKNADAFFKRNLKQI